MNQGKHTSNGEQKERKEQEERLRIAQRARELESPEEEKRIIEGAGYTLIKLKDTKSIKIQKNLTWRWILGIGFAILIYVHIWFGELHHFLAPFTYTVYFSILFQISFVGALSAVFYQKIYRWMGFYGDEENRFHNVFWTVILAIVLFLTVLGCLDQMYVETSVYDWFRDVLWQIRAVEEMIHRSW